MSNPATKTRGRPATGRPPARPLSVRPPAEVRSRIEDLAARERRTPAAMALLLIEDGLAARGETVQKDS